MSAASRSAEFVESMGLLWESEGLPRIAGRIFGYLVVQPHPCSLDELASGIGVSKASISTDARRLAQLGLIARVGRPGDRRDYYTMDDDAPASGLEIRLRALRRFNKALEDIEDRMSLTPIVRRRLDRFEDAHARIIRALEAVVEELRAQASPAQTSTGTETQP